jgi:hypothetical protein
MAASLQADVAPIALISHPSRTSGLARRDNSKGMPSLFRFRLTWAVAVYETGFHLQSQQRPLLKQTKTVLQTPVVA